MEAMWREAANRHGEYTSHLWVTALAMLYGTVFAAASWSG